MLPKQLQAEKQLAIALGWTNLVESGGTLLGTPPDGGESSRGQAAVPKWARDWAACGPLLSTYNITVDALGFTPADQHVVTSYGSADHHFVLIPVSEWPSRDEALLYAITTAAFVRLADRRSAPRRCTWCAAADIDKNCYCMPAGAGAAAGEAP